MLQRLIICGILLYGAAALDQGFPIWISTPVIPSFLGLLLVLMCQTLRGAELVAWAGAVGFSQDFLAGETPGVGIMTAATLALLMAWWQHESTLPMTFPDRLMGGLGLFLCLGLAQGVKIMWESSTVPLEALASSLMIRLAATYLLFVLVNGIWCGVRLGRRSAYWLENSCV